MKRQLRTRLTLLKPNLAQAVENKQMKQKLYHDKSKVERSFTVNEPVRVRITDRGFTSQSAKWSSGVVLEVCGDRWYLVGGVDVEENLEIVGKVLERLQKYNV